MFPLIAFTPDTVSRLTGLSISQLQRWDRSGFFIPTFADPHRRRPSSRVYSYADVVGLRTIAKLREQGASFHSLKKVREFFSSQDGERNEDWASRRFWVVGNQVFFAYGEAVLAAKPLGQRADTRVLELGPIVSDVEEAVRQLPIRSPEQVGQVTSDRLIMSGAPIIAGTRIPTAMIDWFSRHGYEVQQILQEFPRLTERDIEAAIAFERCARAESGERTAAAG